LECGGRTCGLRPFSECSNECQETKLVVVKMMGFVILGFIIVDTSPIQPPSCEQLRYLRSHNIAIGLLNESKMHSLHEFVLQQTATLSISNDSTTDMITSNSQASERFLNGGSILLQTISHSSLRVTERPRECASEVEGPSRKKRRIAHPFNINPRQLEPLLDSIALLLQVNPESKGTTAVAFDLEGSCHGQVVAKDYAI